MTVEFKVNLQALLRNFDQMLQRTLEAFEQGFDAIYLASMLPGRWRPKRRRTRRGSQDNPLVEADNERRVLAE